MCHFNKSAKLRPRKLHKVLTVEYSGEAGANSGSLRREFFEDSLRESSLLLFDGPVDRCIPKKECSLLLLCEVAGMLLAHSILQEGPGMPCFSPRFFNYLVTPVASDCYPTLQDIPLNLATHELISFIRKVCCCIVSIWIRGCMA